MKSIADTSNLQRQMREVGLARARVAAAESLAVTAKEQAREAKRKRKEVRRAARGARKRAKQAKAAVAEARRALAQAQANLAAARARGAGPRPAAKRRRLVKVAAVRSAKKKAPAPSARPVAKISRTRSKPVKKPSPRRIRRVSAHKPAIVAVKPVRVPREFETPAPAIPVPASAPIGDVERSLDQPKHDDAPQTEPSDESVPGGTADR